MSHFCVYFWKTNTDNLAHIYPALPNRSPMVKQTKICLLENTSWKHDLLFMSLSKGRWGCSERFLHKSKRSFRWGIFSSMHGTRLLESQTDSDKTYKPVMISHRRPFVLRKRSKLQKEYFIGVTREISHTSLILLVTIRESPSAK